MWKIYQTSRVVGFSSWRFRDWGLNQWAWVYNSTIWGGATVPMPHSQGCHIFCGASNQEMWEGGCVGACGCLGGWWCDPGGCLCVQVCGGVYLSGRLNTTLTHTNPLTFLEGSCWPEHLFLSTSDTYWLYSRKIRKLEWHFAHWFVQIPTFLFLDSTDPESFDAATVQHHILKRRPFWPTSVFVLKGLSTEN
jgi:hypothetical protein